MFDTGQAASAVIEVATTLVIIAAIVGMLEGVLYLVLVRWLKWRLAVPVMLLAPAVLGLLALNLYPLLWELNVSFTKMGIRNFFDPGFLGLTAKRNIFVGFENYVGVFTQPILQEAGFIQLFTQTVIWTVINLVCHVLGGMGLALCLNRPLRGRGLYRSLLILPWAIPAFISLQIWRTEYNQEFGAVNQLLGLIGLGPIAWLSDPFWNFVAMIVTNVWLGIPFMMVIILGGLQSISGDYYEAAAMDGASGWQQFRSITLPLLRPVLTPAVILGTIWTFNNINVSFFINANRLETSDILVTGLYRAAFEYSRYGFAAAFAFVIFAILLVFSIVYVRRTGALKGAYE